MRFLAFGKFPLECGNSFEIEEASQKEGYEEPEALWGAETFGLFSIRAIGICDFHESLFWLSRLVEGLAIALFTIAGAFSFF